MQPDRSPVDAGRFARCILALSAFVLGGGSLLLLLPFLFLGSTQYLELELATGGALVLDAALCLAFFVQHSAMVRAGFRRRLGRWIDEVYHPAIYALGSGVALLALLLLWQPAPTSLIEVEGALRQVLRGVFWLALAGFGWCTISLGPFDGLGAISALRGPGGGVATRPVLSARGPYRWVRHPMYFLVLLLIWTCPDVAADRLLFDLLFSLWIVVGTALEERDLVERLGEPYRRYQRTVPMLLPYRWPDRVAG